MHPNSRVMSVLPLKRMFNVICSFLCNFSTNTRLCFLAHVPSPGVVTRSFSRVEPQIVSYMPLVMRGVVGGSVLPQVSGGVNGLLLQVPVIGSGVGTSVHGGTVRMFNDGFSRVVVKKTPFGTRIRHFLGRVNFPCAVTCKVARYNPVVYSDH